LVWCAVAVDCALMRAPSCLAGLLAVFRPSIADEEF
jgi:hypothetical protein